MKLQLKARYIDGDDETILYYDQYKQAYMRRAVKEDLKTLRGQGISATVHEDSNSLQFIDLNITQQELLDKFRVEKIV